MKNINSTLTKAQSLSLPTITSISHGSSKFSFGVVNSKKNGKRLSFSKALVAKLELTDKTYITPVKEDGVITNFAIAGGTLFVSETECKIITSAIEKETEIDFSRAQKAKERAEKRLNAKDEDIDIKRAEIALKRAINRLTLK